MFIASGYFAGFANGQFDVAPIAKLMTWFLSGAFLGFIPQFFNKNKKIVTGPDPLIVGSTAHVIGRDEHILGKSLRPGNGKKKRGI